MLFELLDNEVVMSLLRYMGVKIAYNNKIVSLARKSLLEGKLRIFAKNLTENCGL